MAVAMTVARSVLTARATAIEPAELSAAVCQLAFHLGAVGTRIRFATSGEGQ